MNVCRMRLKMIKLQAQGIVYLELKSCNEYKEVKEDE